MPDAADDTHLSQRPTPDDPALDGWYHTIELGNGLVTRGFVDHRPVLERFGLPATLRGKSALDVGAGDGFMAFELERRGAEPVLAIDVASLGECDWLPPMLERLGGGAADQPWTRRFMLARELLASRVAYRQLSVYDLDPEAVGLFDVVFCGSLLLHLRNPLEALLRVRSVTREVAVVETAIHPALEEEAQGRPLAFFGAFRESEPGEENTFWLLTTPTLERMLRYAGFRSTEPQGIFEIPGGPVVTVVHARP